MSKTESEARLQRRIQQIIKEHGCYVFKNNGNMFTEAGRPDLVACVPTHIDTLETMIKEGWFGENNLVGIFTSFEVKRENRLDELSSAQEIVGKQIGKAAGLWFAVDNTDDVYALIRRMRGEL